MAGDPDKKLQLVIEALSDGQSRVKVGALRELLNMYVVSAVQVVLGLFHAALMLGNNRGLQELAEIAELTEEVVAGLDVDGTGAIPQSRFRSQLLANPALFDCVQSSAACSGLDGLMPEYHSLPQAHKVTLAQVDALWDRFHVAIDGSSTVSDSELQVTITEKEAARILLHDLGCHADAISLFSRAFRKLDKENQGAVPRDEWLQMLGQIAGGVKKDVVDFLFKVFDANGNGELEMDELRTMVVHGQQEKNKNARVTMRILRGFEFASKDKSIGHRQLKDLFFKHPRVLQCFSQLLGIGQSERTAKQQATEIGRLLLGDPTLAMKSKPSFRVQVELNPDAQDGLDRLRKSSLRTASNIVSTLQRELHTNTHPLHPRSRDKSPPRSRAGAGYVLQSSHAVRQATKQYVVSCLVVVTRRASLTGCGPCLQVQQHAELASWNSARQGAHGGATSQGQRRARCTTAIGGAGGA